MKTENLARTAAVSKRNCAASGAFCLIFSIVAVLLLFGVVVCAVLSETAFRSPQNRTLLYILAGSFGGGAALFALAAYGMGKLSVRFDARARDARERADSPHSFYVGEKVLATFSERALELHREDGGERIRVPYPELTLYSVCSRNRPRERGTWKVVLGIPSKYLRKRVEKGEETALVETDYKPRLMETVEKRGLSLIGEPYRKVGNGVRFSRMKQFKMPLDAKRKRMIVFAAAGGAAAVAGIALAFLSPFLGAVVTVFGLFFALRSAWRAVATRRALAVYREGIFWKDERPEERLFLKWEEIERLAVTEEEGVAGLRADCACGSYVLPLPAGAYGYLEENFPEKCGGRRDDASAQTH